MSPLPPATLALLTDVTCAIDEKLQADGHRVGRVLGWDDAFDERWVESTLLRAMVAKAVSSTAAECRPLANGGRELVVAERRVERQIRVKIATRDERGLKILVSPASKFGQPVRAEPSLFPDIRPDVIEQWVLALILNDDFRTLAESVAARVVGFVPDRARRLRLNDEYPITFVRPVPPPFGGGEEDLDWQDDDAGDEGVEDDTGDQPPE